MAYRVHKHVAKSKVDPDFIRITPFGPQPIKTSTNRRVGEEGPDLVCYSQRSHPRIHPSAFVQLSFFRRLFFWYYLCNIKLKQNQGGKEIVPCTSSPKS